MEQLDIYKCATSSNRDLKIQRRDGNENVTLNLNARSFSLHRNYSYPVTLSNVGELNS